MARRVVNGSSFSENGWPLVDQQSCRWIIVPGTDPPVHLEIQDGPPAIILGAFAADVNAYVEKLRDGDSGCWTATNDVLGSYGKNNGSNHLGGTAMDLNWNGADGKTFRFQIDEARAWPPPKNAVLREILDFYEDMVYCGGFWNIRDWMHFQMGGGTYNNQDTWSFINRKIRSDGYSTFRRGATVIKPKLTPMDRYALEVIRAGRDLGVSPRGIVIALSVPFAESEWQMYANRNIPESLNLPHDKVGGDHDSNGLFQQRMAWGPLSCTMDPYCSAKLFYLGGADGQRGLTDFDYNSGDMGELAANVQQPAAQYRYRYGERMSEAQALYDRLANTAPPVTPPIQEDDMAQVPQQQWDALFHALMDPVPSQSALRMPGEGVVGNPIQLIRNIDGMVHPMLVELLARLGDPREINRLHAVADTSEAGREADAALAATILDRIASGDPVLVTNPAVSVAPVAAAVEAAVPAAPVVVSQPYTVTPSSTTGQLIGAAYDALAALQLSSGLPTEAKAPMEALIGVLKTYPKDET